MIIDMHCHIWEPAAIRGGMRDLMESVTRELPVGDPQSIRDGSCARLIRDMDAAGIDKTVVLPLARRQCAEAPAPLSKALAAALWMHTLDDRVAQIAAAPGRAQPGGHAMKRAEGSE